MSVFYKFKSAKDYDTIPVEGNGISLTKLKQSIATQKKLPKTMDYDLVLENAQTGEVYKYDQDVVPKNTSVLVKRVPVTRSVGSANNNPSANSQPAIIPPSNNNSSSLLSTNPNPNQKSLTGSLFSRNTSSSDTATSFASVFSANGAGGNDSSNGGGAGGGEETIGEEQKLRDLANNTGKWIPDTPSQQQHHSQSKRVPPPNYICHRCKKTGHYIQHCPTNGDVRYNIKTIRIPVGIPKSFLQPIEAPKADSNNTVVMPGGNLAVLAPNEKEFSKILGKKAVELKDIPKEFQCALCSKILNDAVTIPCCKSNYCNNCITHALIHDTHLTCPNCKSPDQSIDNLAPNYHLRKRVDNYKVTLDVGAPPSLVATALSNYNGSSNSTNSTKSSPPRQSNNNNYNNNSNTSNNSKRYDNDNKQDSNRNGSSSSYNNSSGGSGSGRNYNNNRRSPPRRDNSYNDRRSSPRRDNYDSKRGGGGRNDSYDRNDRGGGSRNDSYDSRRGEKRGYNENRRSEYESDRKRYKD